MTAAELKATSKDEVTWYGHPGKCSKCGGITELAHVEVRRYDGSWGGNRFTRRCQDCGLEYNLGSAELAQAKEARRSSSS